MEWMISLAQLLLSLSFLVAVHEFGHLLAAKYFGMRVEQFSIGFPPKIWSFKKGETEYALSAIPLGGYVKISGMIDESLDTEAMKREPQPWEFRSKPAWQRLIVMLGGIFVNVVVGVLIFIAITFVYGDEYILKDEINKKGGFAVGAVGETLKLQSGDKFVKINGKDFLYVEELLKASNLLETNASYTVDRNGEQVNIDIPHDFIENFSKMDHPSEFISIRIPAKITAVEKDSIAGKIGLKAGDIFTTFNGKEIQYQDEITNALRKFKGKEITMSVLRNGQKLDFTSPYKQGGKLGVEFKVSKEYFAAARVQIKYGFVESIPLGAKNAFETLSTQVKAFGKILTGKLNARKSLSGPIGIMDAFGQSWDWERFWSLTGVLSLVLAFMNLLPIPALDGGHVAFLSYEMISRRKPSDKFLENAQKVGMVLLLGLMIFIFANDIINKIAKYYN
jgi:regulator of sigma E protease